MLKKLKTWIFKKKIKAVIFDYDGVLNDSLDIIRGLYNEFYRRGVTNLYFKDNQEFTNFFQGDSYKNMEAAGMEVNKENIELSNGIINEFLNEKDPTVGLFPGIDELLLKLKDENYKLGIVSNGDKNIIKNKLKMYNVESVVDSIIGYEQVSRTKPSPEGLLKCLDELKVKPEQALYVGDMKSDVDAAKAADVKVIAVRYGYLHLKDPDNMNEELKDADAFAEDVEDIYILIKNSSLWCKDA